jgi:hypothetical protein
LEFHEDVANAILRIIISGTLDFSKLEEYLLKRSGQMFFYLLSISTRIYAHDESILDLEGRELILIDSKQTVHSEYDHDGDKEVYELTIFYCTFDKTVVFIHRSD